MDEEGGLYGGLYSAVHDCRLTYYGQKSVYSIKVSANNIGIIADRANLVLPFILYKKFLTTYCQPNEWRQKNS